jgi:hypothetical protein
MVKKNVITLSVLFVLSIVSFVAVLNIKPQNKQENQAEKVEAAPAEKNISPGGTDLKSQISSPSVNEIVKSESIPVTNNQDEINMEVLLYENSLNETFLKLEYEDEGKAVKKELSYGNIPELKDMFEKRETVKGSKKGNRISKVYLNTKYKKAYITVEGNPSEKGIDTAVYVYSLKDFYLIKLAAEVGQFTDTVFSGDQEYIAFSYTQGKESKGSFLQVFSCKTDKFKVYRNRYESKFHIGDTVDGSCFYEFVNWQTENILELNEIPYSAGTGEVLTGNGKQRTVYYNVEKNAFVNPDGSELQNTASKQGEGTKTGLGNQPAELIEAFYRYLSAEQYKKAYDLLDDSFTFNAFKGLGIPGFKKSSIKEEEFPFYTSVLKMTRFGGTVAEKTEGNESKVYFYIVLPSGKGSEVRQPLIAGLKKSGNLWKIVSVIDGNIKEAPFKQ